MAAADHFPAHKRSPLRKKILYETLPPDADAPYFSNPMLTFQLVNMAVALATKADIFAFVSGYKSTLSLSPFIIIAIGERLH